MLRDPSRKAYELSWAWTTKKSQKAKEKQSFGFLMRKYKEAGQDGEDERFEALLMNEAE